MVVTRTSPAPHNSLARSPSSRLAPLVFLTVASSSIVLIEPAPTDALFALAMAIEILIFGRVMITSGNTLADTGLYAFLFANAISLAFTTNPVASLRFFGITIYMLLIYVYFGQFLRDTGRAGCHQLFSAYLVAATLCALVGLLTRFDMMPMAEMFVRDETGLRLRSTFKDPNVFAPFLVAASLIVLDRLLHESRHRSLYLILLILFLLNILFAFSRGAFGHLVVSAGIFIVLSMALTLNAGRSLLLVVTALFSVGIMIVVGDYLLNQLDLFDLLVKRSSLQGYDDERFANQLVGLHVFIDMPFGIGPGEYNVENFIRAAHSLYIRVLVENGIFGVFGWLVFLASNVAILTQSLCTRTIVRREMILCLAVVLGILSESIIIDTLHWRHLFFYLGAGLGLAYWARTEVKAPARTTEYAR